MSEELRKFTEVDRLIHEPARLLILTILAAVEKTDFLYLLRETGLTPPRRVNTPWVTFEFERLSKVKYRIGPDCWKGIVIQETMKIRVSRQSH